MIQSFWRPARSSFFICICNQLSAWYYKLSMIDLTKINQWDWKYRCASVEYKKKFSECLLGGELIAMFEKISSSFIRLAKLLKQCGQVSVLFAFLMPIFILCVGLVLDLGWYYLNVSRLQNAADAAAVAGAQKIITDKTNFSSYKNVTLVGQYPAKVSN